MGIKSTTQLTRTEAEERYKQVLNELIEQIPNISNEKLEDLLEEFNMFDNFMITETPSNPLLYASPPDIEYFLDGK